MPDRVYEETEWLPAIILGVTAVGFAVVAAVARQWAMTPPAGLMLLLAVTLFWRVALTFDELTVRFGIWGISVCRISRIDAQSAEVFARKWDGMNWPVRRVTDISAHVGGKERGALVRTAKGDLWIQSRRPESLVEAVRIAWYLAGDR
jgi:hypothetical protein